MFISLVPILLLTGLHPFTPKSDHLILIVSQINKAIYSDLINKLTIISLHNNLFVPLDSNSSKWAHFDWASLLYDSRSLVMGSWLQPISIKVNVTRSQWEFKVKTRKLHEARGNAIVQVTVGFSSQSDWLRKWRELSRPVSARSKAKPKQSQNSFRHSEKLPNRSFKVIDARASHKPRPTNGWILKISRHALKWAVTQDLPKDRGFTLFLHS